MSKTIKDQIPQFPDLIGIYSLRNYVAHGTDDNNEISKKYYSQPEREYAEDLSLSKIVELLKNGSIRATGRLSNVPKGQGASWSVQQYKEHSKVREYIRFEFWREFVFVKSSRLNTARNEYSEYADLMVVIDDCKLHLLEDINAHRSSDNGDDYQEAEPDSQYSTPYIELMWKAIDEFKISASNQPLKETLVEWFLEQEIAGQKLSQATANYLASFVRLPESRLGGNRPWRVRAQKTQEP